ncbi:transposable element Tcb1 transposase [Trichonephila clavipes]|nr:transposable element Tcb1 transposase [Trichonephila clavipes]
MHFVNSRLFYVENREVFLVPEEEVRNIVVRYMERGDTDHELDLFERKIIERKLQEHEAHNGYMTPRQLHEGCIFLCSASVTIAEDRTRNLRIRFPLQTSCREDRHIVRNARVLPTASSAAIQAQVRPSLGAPVSSQTIRRHLDEGHLGSRRRLRVLHLTPTRRCLRLEWCHTRGNWTEAEWNEVVFSDANRDSISAVMTIMFMCGGPVVNAFALQRHTAPTAGVMVWGTVPYNTRSHLVFIRGTMTAQWYVHVILQPHVLPLMQRLLGAIFQQDNARPHTARVSQVCLSTVTTFPWSARSPDLSPIEHVWDLLGRRVEHPRSLNELEAR